MQLAFDNKEYIKPFDEFENITLRPGHYLLTENKYYRILEIEEVGSSMIITTEEENGDNIISKYKISKTKLINDQLRKDVSFFRKIFNNGGEDYADTKLHTSSR